MELISTGMSKAFLLVCVYITAPVRVSVSAFVAMTLSYFHFYFN